MRVAMFLVFAGASCLVATACADPRESAARSLAEAERSFAELKLNPARDSPNTMGHIEELLHDARKKYSEGDFEAVIDQAPALMSAIAIVEKGAAADGEAQSQVAAGVANWSSWSSEVSTTLAFLESRIEVLATPGASSKTIDRATLDTARSELVALKKTWGEANEAFSSGNAAAAIGKIDIVRRKSAELLKKVGVKPG